MLDCSLFLLLVTLMVGRRAGLQQPKGGEIRAQCSRRREMDRVNTEGTRGRCVGLDVVDKDGAQRVDREALEQNLVNPRLRLDRTDLARDHDAAKPAEE